jgi:hypothetical protein
VRENLDRQMEICAGAIAISFALAGALGGWFLFDLTKKVIASLWRSQGIRKSFS